LSPRRSEEPGLLTKIAAILESLIWASFYRVPGAAGGPELPMISAAAGRETIRAKTSARSKGKSERLRWQIAAAHCVRFNNCHR
jgi:hypothetical protein